MTIYLKMNTLSDTIIIKILSYLNAPALGSLQRVNHKWSNLAKSDTLWERHVKQNFGNVPKVKSYYITYKHYYGTIPYIHLIVNLKGLRSQKAIQLFKYLKTLKLVSRPLDYSSDLKLYIQCDSYGREIERVVKYGLLNKVQSYLNSDDLRMIKRTQRESKKSMQYR